MALILKSGKRLKSKINAQNLLEEVIKEGILVDTHVVAHLHLIDILLDELSLYGEEEVLINIQDNIKLLQDQARDEHQNPLLIESYILEARLHLISLNLEQAIKILEKAYELSNSLKILYLVEKSSNEINELRMKY